MKYKECKECKQTKVEALGFCRTGFIRKDGSKSYRAKCKSCYNSNWKYRIISGMTSREYVNRSRVTGQKKKPISRDRKINVSFLEKLKNRQLGKCYWLGIELDFTMKDKLRKPSLDRLDNSKGYEVDNVVLTTVFANTGRRDATVSEMRGFLKNHLYK